MTQQSEGMGIEAFFSIWADECKKQTSAIDRALKIPLPIINYTGGSIVGASGTNLLPCKERPAAGRVWEVLRVGLFGTDGHTAVSGAIADVFAGPSAGMDNPDGDFQAQFLTGISIPYIDTIKKHGTFLQHNDCIYAWIFSSPGSQQYVIAAQYYDWAIEDIARLHQ